MPSPEVILVNRVRARAAHAETALREAVELLRAPAAAPGYSGPDIEVVSRLVEVVGEIRAQAVNWGIAEVQLSRRSRGRRSLP
jgi:hypothetical protein